MTRVVFAKTRWVYASYTDFYRLAERAGYPTCFVDEIDLREPVVYVTSPWNGETVPALRAARRYATSPGKIVWWNLERDAPDASADDRTHPYLDLVDEVWVSDRIGAAIHEKFRHVVLGGHPDFGSPCAAKMYDVCTLAYLWGRRQEIADELRRRDRTLAPEAWGRNQQDRYVATSRLMLNMLQHGTVKVAAPIRFAVAASYGLPIVSETVLDPWPLVDGKDFLMVAFGSLVSTVEGLLDRTDDYLQRLALGLRSRLVLEHRFDVGVDRAAEELMARSRS